MQNHESIAAHSGGVSHHLYTFPWFETWFVRWTLLWGRWNLWQNEFRYW
jgi:hypothetical protein